MRTSTSRCVRRPSVRWSNPTPCARRLGAAKRQRARRRKQRGLRAARDNRPGEKVKPTLGRRDAILYLTAAGLGSFGLGVAQFYLNFLYRSLGFDAFAIGLLAGAEALGVVAGAIPAAIFTRGRSRRAAILFGGTLTGGGIFGMLIFNALPPVFLSAMLVGFGGIIASSSGAALLADATDAARRATRFGQQIALGTTAAFLSSVIAGALAAPVATLLGARPDDALVLRALVGSGGLIAAASIVPILAIRAMPVARPTLEAPTRNDLVRRFLAIEILFG